MANSSLIDTALATPAPRRTAWFGWAISVASLFAFSVAPPIAKVSYAYGLDPTTTLVVRFAISALLLGLTILFTVPSGLRLPRRGLIFALLAGLINGIGNLTYFWALTRMSTSVSTMLFSLSPLATLGMLALRGERYTYRQIIRLALGLGGAYLLIGPSGGADVIGILLIGIAVLGSAALMSLMQWYLLDYDARVVTFYIIVAMGGVSAVFWAFQGVQWPPPIWQSWAVILSLALICTYFARLALLVGVQHIGSSQLSLLSPVETALTVIWSVIFLSEQLTLIQWLGSALILISALLAAHRLNRANVPATAHPE